MQYLNCNSIATARHETTTRQTKFGRARSTLMSEGKDSFANSTIEGDPCKRKLYFYSQEDGGLEVSIIATSIRRK